jgi:hypothetical protein
MFLFLGRQLGNPIETVIADPLLWNIAPSMLLRENASIVFGMNLMLVVSRH